VIGFLSLWCFFFRSDIAQGAPKLAHGRPRTASTTPYIALAIRVTISASDPEPGTIRPSKIFRGLPAPSYTSARLNHLDERGHRPELLAKGRQVWQHRKSRIPTSSGHPTPRVPAGVGIPSRRAVSSILRHLRAFHQHVHASFTRIAPNGLVVSGRGIIPPLLTSYRWPTATLGKLRLFPSSCPERARLRQFPLFQGLKK